MGDGRWEMGEERGEREGAGEENNTLPAVSIGRLNEAMHATKLTKP